MKYIIIIASLGFLLTGCSNPVEISTDPAKVVAPDKELLLDIARKAIAVRLPNVSFDNLELRTLSYRWHIEDYGSYTNDSFDLSFRVKDGKRKAKEDRSTVYTVDDISVEIQPDGKIDEGGVGKDRSIFTSSRMNVLSLQSIEGNPIWGEPFYPVKLEVPLPKPNKKNLEQIALRALKQFRPSVDASDLKLRSASFTDTHSPENKIDHTGFKVLFWESNSVNITETESTIKIDRTEITVSIDANGQVREKDIESRPSTTERRKHNKKTEPAK